MSFTVNLSGGGLLTVENMEELPDEVLQEQLVTESLEAAEMVQTETIKRYVPIDIRV